MNLKLTDGKYLVGMHIDTKVKADSAVTNYIMMLDRSGSTYWFSDTLINDSQSHIREIENGSTITVIQFSSEGGDYSYIVKGMTLNNDNDKDRVCLALDKYRNARNLTCFSEMLGSLDSAMSDITLLSGSDKFAVFLFTDGQPVVNNRNREITNIFTAIDAIKDRVSSALVLGYGNWYDKDLLSRMTTRLGGTLLHASNMVDYSKYLNHFVTSDKQSRVKVNLPLGVNVVFSINNGMLVTYHVNNGTVNYTPSDDNNIYYVSDSYHETEDLTESDVYKLSDMVVATYGLALLYSQQSKGDRALEVLALTGDKALIDMLSNSYTNAEYGNVENKLVGIINNTANNLTQGYVRNYVPDYDAFSLVDALFLLEEDEDAHFYPYEIVDYKRVGAKIKSNSKFKADSKPHSKVSLVWNKTRLNVNIKAVISGHVPIPSDKADELGLPHKHRTIQYRDRTIIKDGTLNMSRLPVSISRNTFDTLQTEGLIDIYEHWFEGSVYQLDLEAVPVINRVMAYDNKSAERLAKLRLREIQHEAEYKVLRFMSNKYYPKEYNQSNKLSHVYSSEAVEYLKSLNITDGGYNPKTTTMKPTDYYEAKTFKIKVKGLSKLPSLNAVYKKTNSGKDLTVSETILASAMDDYPLVEMAELSESIFETLIKSISNKRNLVRNEITKAKFSVILGKQWFDEFSSREDNKLTVNGFTYTFEIDKEQVGY